MALRPRLSPGVPLSRDGKQELRAGTRDVNKASGAIAVSTPAYHVPPHLIRRAVYGSGCGGSSVNSNSCSPTDRTLPACRATRSPAALHALRVPLEHADPVARQPGALPEEFRFPRHSPGCETLDIGLMQRPHSSR